MSKLLLVDDDETFLKITVSFLNQNGWEVETAENAKDFFMKLDPEEISSVLVDLQLRNESGIDIIKGVRLQHPYIPIMMCTAHGTIETAVHAMKLGALDYILKPINYDELLIKLNRIEGERLRNSELKELQSRFKLRQTFDDLITQNPEMKKIITLCRSILHTDTTILIQGETGTGKEILAKAIHFESERRMKPFVVVNCAAIPENLIESELFGHEKGAFTDALCRKKGKFEAAADGTLFLDEIGELPLKLQKKILRVLQEQEFERIGSTRTLKSRCRIIAATNRDLKNMVNAGRFREDLYYRLKVFPVFVPPLKERKEDIPLLIDFFMKKYCVKYNRNTLKVSSSFITAVQNTDLPGNVRELEHLVEKNIILSSGTKLEFHSDSSFQPDYAHEEIEDSYKDFIRKKERIYFSAILKRFHGDTEKAAEFAKISRKTVYDKINNLDLKTQ
ncbi:MAG: sigma-54-dependent Fis family transcriptional regulator [Candidatus Aureabacteria bacterium]|nr:sigma-54-dependent Fis family transcriptional regulator [Candidatus Auribacterota bacterium]